MPSSGVIETLDVLEDHRPRCLYSTSLLFWIAFVLTRRYGATFGDVLTKSPDEGGIGFGSLGSSLIMTAILVIFIIYTTLNKDKVVERELVEPEAVESKGR